MRRSAVVVGLWVSALVGAGCTPPHAVLTVNDPLQVAANADVLSITAAGGAAQTVALDGASFPLTVTLTGNREGERPVTVDALVDGTAVARGRSTVTFSRESLSPVRLDFGAACAGLLDGSAEELDERCDDGVFCNGFEHCVGGICRAAPPACPERNRCLVVTCNEEQRTCDEAPDHADCLDRLQQFDPSVTEAYCSVTGDCGVRTPCVADEECDDGLGCNGTETCRGYGCFAGEDVVFASDNPCAVSTCVEPGEEAFVLLTNGTPCPRNVNAPDDLDGQCIDGACEEVVFFPPETPIWLLRDSTGSTSVMLERDVGVEIVNVDAFGGMRFAIGENLSLAPGPLSAAWQDLPPTTFTLSEGAGDKTVYLWVENAFGLVSAQSTQTVLLIDGLITVGHSIAGCPESTGGPCQFVEGTVPNAVQDAVDAASPGDVVRLYPGEYTVQPAVRVDKSIVIEGAPGSDPRDVVVHNSGNTNGPDDAEGVFQLLADNVTLRGLFIDVQNSGEHAVNTFYPGSFASTGHLLDRLWVEATQLPWAGANGTTMAFVLHEGTTLRNSVVQGWFEVVAEVRPHLTAPGPVRLLNNTALHNEPTPGIVVLDGAKVHVAHNAFVSGLTDESPFLSFEVADYEGSAANFNIVQGYLALAPIGLSEAGNVLQPTPFLASFADPRPADPTLIDGGLDTTVDPGPIDILGNPRVLGAALDIGAFETDQTLVPLQSPVTVGELPEDCVAMSGAACDFSVLESGDTVLQQVVAAAPTGADIELHPGAGGTAAFPATDVDIARPMRLVGRGATPLDVTLDNALAGGSASGLIDVTHGDGVVIENLRLLCNGCGDAIDVDRGSGSTPSSVSAANNLLIDRVWLEGVGSSAGFALDAGHGTTLQNSVVVGDFDSFVAHDLSGFSLLYNTVVIDNPSDSLDLLDLESADSVLIEGNVFATFGPLDPLDSFFDASLVFNGPIQHNLFVADIPFDPAWPIVLIDDGGTNCTTTSGAPSVCAGDAPGFVNAPGLDLSLTAGSAALDFGPATPALSSSVDFLGNPRVVGAAIDAGAFERQ